MNKTEISPEEAKRLDDLRQEKELERLRRKHERDTISSEHYLRKQASIKAWREVHAKYKDELGLGHLSDEEQNWKLAEFMLRAGIEINTIAEAAKLTRKQVMQIQQELNI